jgi:hypothetical protein
MTVLLHNKYLLLSVFISLLTQPGNFWTHPHIDKTCNEIRSNLLIINRLSKVADLYVMRTIYYGFIYPFL